jgi:hypothetical protein
MISQKEEMRTGTESSGVVLHDMIERFFYFIIFSQKRNGKRETHGRRGSSRCPPTQPISDILRRPWVHSTCVHTIGTVFRGKKNGY